jgi:quercetin dioxygenase-like cupin family protein
MAAAAPTAEPHEVLAAVRAEGLSAYRWDNGPHAVYATHRHPYHKVLYCLRGSIRFVLGGEGEAIELRAGDRLDLPAQTEHGAVVGPEGVVCLEVQSSPADLGSCQQPVRWCPAT